MQARYYLEKLDFFQIRNITIFDYRYNDHSYNLYSVALAEAERTTQKEEEFTKLMQYLATKFAYSLWLDFSNTFKPYPKDNGNVIYLEFDLIFDNAYGTEKQLEWWQPWIGIKHLVGGLAGLIATPFMLLNDLIQDLFRSKSLPHLLYNGLLSVALVIPRLLNSAAHVVKGLTQIVATPLTWLVKKPLRSLLSGARNLLDSHRKIEKSPSIQASLEVARRELLEEHPRLEILDQEVQKINTQYTQALQQRRKTNIPNDQEKAALASHRVAREEPGLNPVQTAKRFFGLFSQDPVFVAEAAEGLPHPGPRAVSRSLRRGGREEDEG
jgi:hypothetical protein